MKSYLCIHGSGEKLYDSWYEFEEFMKELGGESVYSDDFNGSELKRIVKIFHVDD